MPDEGRLVTQDEINQAMGEGHKKTVERLLSAPRIKISQDSRHASSESRE